MSDPVEIISNTDTALTKSFDKTKTMNPFSYQSKGTMDVIKETFQRFFNNEQIKMEMREFIKPIGNLIYQEIYIYLWFLCLYHVVLLFIIVAVLCLLMRKL